MPDIAWVQDGNDRGRWVNLGWIIYSPLVEPKQRRYRCFEMEKVPICIANNMV